MSLLVKTAVRIKVPSPPNFIRIGDTYQPIKDIPDDILRKIGKQWTAQLLEKAKWRRGRKP